MSNKADIKGDAKQALQFTSAPLSKTVGSYLRKS